MYMLCSKMSNVYIINFFGIWKQTGNVKLYFVNTRIKCKGRESCFTFLFDRPTNMSSKKCVRCALKTGANNVFLKDQIYTQQNF